VVKSAGDAADIKRTRTATDPLLSVDAACYPELT